MFEAIPSDVMRCDVSALVDWEAVPPRPNGPMAARGIGKLGYFATSGDLGRAIEDELNANWEEREMTTEAQKSA